MQGFRCRLRMPGSTSSGKMPAFVCILKGPRFPGAQASQWRDVERMQIVFPFILLSSVKCSDECGSKCLLSCEMLVFISCWICSSNPSKIKHKFKSCLATSLEHFCYVIYIWEVFNVIAQVCRFSVGDSCIGIIFLRKECWV